MKQLLKLRSGIRLRAADAGFFIEACKLPVGVGGDEGFVMLPLVFDGSLLRIEVGGDTGVGCSFELFLFCGCG